MFTALKLKLPDLFRLTTIFPMREGDAWNLGLRSPSFGKSADWLFASEIGPNLVETGAANYIRK